MFDWTHQIPILSIVCYLPLVGVAIALFMKDAAAIRRFATAVAGIDFLVSVPLWFSFERQGELFQFRESASWIPAIGVRYEFGVDGIALLLVLMTTFLGFLAFLCSWSSIQEREKEYYIFLLLLQTGMLGVFMALDFFLFYVFWEVMLVPMYFLIGIWGGPRKLYAAIKFFLYTLLGSVLMLLGILALYFFNGPGLFGIEGLGNPLTFSMKMGTYGFVRFSLPILPEGTRAWLPWMAALAIIGIIYGALVAMAQKDMKKLVAYSSVSHMGFVMIGLFALNTAGIGGGVLQMVNHGLSTGALFLLVGVIYERRHTRMIAEYGGLSSVMPLYATIFLVITMSSIGLPTLNGFVGEFTILVGVFTRTWWWAVFAATGIVLGAAYMLWMYQRVFFGPLSNPENEDLADLNRRELLYLVPVVVLCFWIGLYPKPFFRVMEKPVDYIVQKVDPDYAAAMTTTAASEESDETSQD